MPFGVHSCLCASTSSLASLADTPLPSAPAPEARVVSNGYLVNNIQKKRADIMPKASALHPKLRMSAQDYKLYKALMKDFETDNKKVKFGNIALLQDEQNAVSRKDIHSKGAESGALYATDSDYVSFEEHEPFRQQRLAQKNHAESSPYFLPEEPQNNPVSEKSRPYAAPAKRVAAVNKSAMKSEAAGFADLKTSPAQARVIKTIPASPESNSPGPKRISSDYDTLRTKAIPAHYDVVRTKAIPAHYDIVRTKAIPAHYDIVRTKAIPAHYDIVKTKAIPVHYDIVRTQEIPIADNVTGSRKKE